MRQLSDLIIESLNFFPAILLLGARQIGKSTLAQELISQKILDQYVTLDDLTTLSAFKADPDGTLASFTNRIALDEIQRVPDLMRALKKNIDENRQNGRFLLTGSANVLSHPNVTESLTGRLDIFILEGLGIAELNNRPNPKALKILLQESVENFKNYLSQLAKSPIIPKLIQADLWEAVFFGHYPEVALAKNIHFKERYFQAYQTTYIEKDVRDLSKGIDIVQFAQVAKALMLQSGSLINMNNLANDLQLDQRTIKRYAELLEATFQIVFLQPWSRNTLKKIIKTPKVYAKDSGFMSFTHRVLSPDKLPESSCFGKALETFVFTELRKQTQMIPGTSTYFYRTHLGKEVDFVLEYGEKLIGLELKTAASVNAKDFAGLQDLEEANHGKLELGIVLYQGTEVLPFGKNKLAVPLKYFLFS